MYINSWSTQPGLTISIVLFNAMLKIDFLKLMLKIRRKKNLNYTIHCIIRPTLEYTSVVWNGCSTHESEKLKKVQNLYREIFYTIHKDWDHICQCI